MDLSFRIDRRLPSGALVKAFDSEAFRELLEGWRSGSLADSGRLWIELDLPVGSALGESPSGGLPLPIVCIERTPGGVELSEVLGILRRRELSRSQSRTIDEWSRRMPRGARVLYAFGLWSRPGAPVRVEWVGLPMADAAGVLRPLVPPSVMAAVERGGGLMAGVERPHVSFDLVFGSDSGVEVLPRVGLEGSFRSPPEKDPRWRSLLERWTRAGLCSAAKAEAFLQASGVDTYWTARGDWPADEVGLAGHAVRRLSHCKLVARPNGQLEAKAYLLFQFVEGKDAALPASIES
ncbi:MAG: hypothetical protein AAF481_13050 [Acidobacteriota bacterium]